ncbi:sensor histidine kinase [Pseudoalteromonas denitrificans]|uniref:histidine kinase n=1 Tax=Pseudoalteromonas denitrificans DSM 6059 TaxID=1123010 RepID=A0A1I1NS24_9GAMM|nr:ATP-binding protein [Pseudoalteromonas denitrificans]SFD00082.1 two-component system, OmpR family, sensor histidine kinase RstB [Pseudoalteromonas denitrificans DSM 6059]
MLISNKKTSVIISVMLFINLVVASLLDTHVYYPLENYLLNKYTDYLLLAKEDLKDEFYQSDNTLWQNKAITLGAQYKAQCIVSSRNSGNLSQENFNLLKLKQSQSGLLDLETAMVYYPLDDEYIVELGPIPFNNWMTFIADWFSWTCAILINICLAFLYLSHTENQRKKITQTVLNLPFDFNQNNVDIYDHLKELQNLIIKTYDKNETRLILQRDLLHGVAHEFRSPMARIQFALEMLEDTPESEQGSLRKSMHDSLADLDKLVKELLYYARIKDTESAIQNEDINLNELCLSAIGQVEHFYNQMLFEFQSREEIYFKGDKNLVKRMLINLLRNAGRFASSKCKIQILSNNFNVVILIQDDGVGIPPGKTDRIFEPFTRLDPSRSRDSGGCGLGLAIVASIINKHKGNIRVIEGELGGACFKISLPK